MQWGKRNGPNNDTLPTMPDCKAPDCIRSYNLLTTTRKRNAIRDGDLEVKRRSRLNEESGYTYCIQNVCEARICRGKPGMISFVRSNTAAVEYKLETFLIPLGPLGMHTQQAR